MHREGVEVASNPIAMCERVGEKPTGKACPSTGFDSAKWDF